MWILKTILAFVLLLFSVLEHRRMIKTQEEMNKIDFNDEFDRNEIMGFLTKDFYISKIWSILWVLISILVSSTFVGRIFTPSTSPLLYIGIVIAVITIILVIEKIIIPIVLKRKGFIHA